MITDLETWRPSQPHIGRPPAAAAPTFREDEDLPLPAPAIPAAPSTADDRIALLERLDAWAASERERVTTEVAAEEQRFGERLMCQLTEFEVQLGARLREQEQKLAGWWSEAERLADERMRAALREVDAA